MTKATQKQLTYLDHLLNDRDIPEAKFQGVLQSGEERRGRMLNHVRKNELSKQQATDAIQYLLNLPKATAERAGEALQGTSYPEVPAGRYALSSQPIGVLEDEVKFYKVDRPTVGPWAGRMFLSLQVSDQLFPVKDAVKRHRIMKLIAADPKAASLLYGKEIGSCGVCGRTLTNEDSRDRGIGPVCAEKLGW